ncbi:hypothetical protein GQ457_14G017050 [Hibiscus cannabinus]
MKKFICELRVISSISDATKLHCDNNGDKNPDLIRDPNTSLNASISSDELWKYKRYKRVTREFQRLRRCSNSLPCEEGILVTTVIKKVTPFPSRDIVYKQDNQLFGLRDKPITQQDALLKSKDLSRYLPGQDPFTRIDEVETLTIDSDAITV